MAVEKLNREVATELGKLSVEDLRATVRLLAEGFREGISPCSMPDIANRPPIVPEEFRPDPT